MSGSCSLPSRNWSNVLGASRGLVADNRGWVEPPDVALTALLSALQFSVRAAYCSSPHTVGEIGVHHGAYWVAVAATARYADRLFACDLFEGGQALNAGRSGRGDLPRFMASARASLGEIEADWLTVVRASSLRLFDDDVRAALAPLPPFRFLSVDGSHSEPVAFSDLRWAASRLAPGGIIALDDIANPSWVGVYRAVRTFFHVYDREYGRLRPLLLTRKKLYLTTSSHHAAYLRALCPLNASARPWRGLPPRLLNAVIGRGRRDRGRQMGGLLDVGALGRVLMAIEPSWNGTPNTRPYETLLFLGPY